MRHLRCMSCMEGKQPGTREIYARSPIGEPAEIERVIIGVAKSPQPDQRWFSVNGKKRPLPLSHYNCDGCSKEIKPGDACGTWTVWTDDMEPVEEWESQFVEVAA